MSELNKCELIFNPKITKEDVKRIILGYYKNVPSFMRPSPSTKEFDNVMAETNGAIAKSVGFNKEFLEVNSL